MILNTIWSNSFDNSIEIALSKLFDSMPHALKNFFIGFSSFGDLGLFLILVAILFLFSKKTRKIGIVFAISLVFSLVINDVILKNIFSRARPTKRKTTERKRQPKAAVPGVTLVPGIYQLLKNRKIFTKTHFKTRIASSVKGNHLTEKE